MIGNWKNLIDDIKCVNADETRGVCKDRSRWRSVVVAYPQWEKDVSLWMYACTIRVNSIVLQSTNCCGCADPLGSCSCNCFMQDTSIVC